jgi:hypothetical protein
MEVEEEATRLFVNSCRALLSAVTGIGSLSGAPIDIRSVSVWYVISSHHLESFGDWLGNGTMSISITFLPFFSILLLLATVLNNQLSGAREVRIDLIDYSFRPSNYQYRLNPYLMELDTYLEVKD